MPAPARPPTTTTTTTTAHPHTTPTPRLSLPRCQAIELYEVDGKEAQAGDVFRGCIASLCKQQNWAEAATLLLQFGAVCDKTKAVATQNKCYLGGWRLAGAWLAAPQPLAAAQAGACCTGAGCAASAVSSQQSAVGTRLPRPCCAGAVVVYLYAQDPKQAWQVFQDCLEVACFVSGRGWAALLLAGAAAAADFAGRPAAGCGPGRLPAHVTSSPWRPAAGELRGGLCRRRAVHGLPQRQRRRRQAGEPALCWVAVRAGRGAAAWAGTARLHGACGGPQFSPPWHGYQVLLCSGAPAGSPSRTGPAACLLWRRWFRTGTRSSTWTTRSRGWRCGCPQVGPGRAVVRWVAAAS
jgi:hypothetical protein